MSSCVLALRIRGCVALFVLKSRSLISQKIERARLSARGLAGVMATGLRPLVDGESVEVSREGGAQNRRARVERAVPKSSSSGENHRQRERKKATVLCDLTGGQLNSQPLRRDFYYTVQYSCTTPQRKTIVGLLYCMVQG